MDLKYLEESWIKHHVPNYGNLYEHRTLPYTIFKWRSRIQIIRAEINIIKDILMKHQTNNGSQSVDRFLINQLFELKIQSTDKNEDELPRYLEVKLEGGTRVNFMFQNYNCTSYSYHLADIILGNNKFTLNTNNKNQLKLISPAMKQIVYNCRRKSSYLRRVISQLLPVTNDKQALRVLKKEPEIRAFFEVLYPKWPILKQLKEKEQVETCYFVFLTAG